MKDELTPEEPQVFHRVSRYYPAKHIHAFTIPVEWIEKMTVNKNGPNLLHTGLYCVTKLACECGEEKERDGNR